MEPPSLNYAFQRKRNRDYRMFGQIPRMSAGTAFRLEPLLVTVLAIAYFLLFGGLLLARTPPFAGQDEPFHWQRVLQIADGHLLADRLGPNSWGGPIDQAGNLQMLYHIDRIQMHGPVDPVEAHALSDHLAAQPRSLVVVAFPSSASFAPLAYLPQAAAVAASRAAGLGPLGQMQAGRFGNLTVYGLVTTPSLGRRRLLGQARRQPAGLVSEGRVPAPWRGWPAAG